jgi:hypothetical protein
MWLIQWLNAAPEDISLLLQSSAGQSELRMPLTEVIKVAPVRQKKKNKKIT